MSYKYVTKKESKPFSSFCSQKLNELTHFLKRKEVHCTFYAIGSYAKNMVTRNDNAPFDLDYNLEITKPLPQKFSSDLKKLKDLIRSELDKLLADTDFSYGKDSISVITYILHLPNKSKVRFSFDVGIVRRNKDGDLQRLIHDKSKDSFTWNIAPDSKDIETRAKFLKSSGYTMEIKEVYLKKKNAYLSNGEKRPSFNVYIETVNEVYSKYFPTEKIRNTGAASDSSQQKQAVVKKICDKVLSINKKKRPKSEPRLKNFVRSLKTWKELKGIADQSKFDSYADSVFDTLLEQKAFEKSKIQNCKKIVWK